jgi:L-iditol 2-dehydrogenase
MSGGTMKAAVLEELNKIVVKEVPIPVIAKDEMLVRVRACSICGTDVRIFHNGEHRIVTPCITGHEISGDVVEVGPEVTRFKVGDRVAIGADVPCGECKFCVMGLSNNCVVHRSTGYQYQGGFAEYIPLSGLMIRGGPISKIADSLSYDEAAIAEPLGCVLNGLEAVNIKIGDSVVIVGVGPIGSMLIEVSRRMGASKIIVIDLKRERLEMAKEFAADVYIAAEEENAIERVLEETDGMGADVVITACPSAKAQVEALDMVKNRGRINFFGGLPHGNSKITIDSNIIHYKEAYIVGTHGSLPRHHSKALELITSGIVDAKKFISHRLPLDRILEGYAIAESKTGRKVIINP